MEAKKKIFSGNKFQKLYLVSMGLCPVFHQIGKKCPVWCRVIADCNFIVHVLFLLVLSAVSVKAGVNFLFPWPCKAAGGVRGAAYTAKPLGFQLCFQCFYNL